MLTRWLGIVAGGVRHGGREWYRWLYAPNQSSSLPPWLDSIPKNRQGQDRVPGGVAFFDTTDIKARGGSTVHLGGQTAAMDSTTIQALLQAIQSAKNDVQSVSTALEKKFPTDSQEDQYGQGPSLLSLKVDTLLSYTHHLLLHSISRCLPPSRHEAGVASSSHRQDLVRNLIRSRLILEKTRPLESKVQHHLQRLLRAAQEEEAEIQSGRKTLPSSHLKTGAVSDLLAYGPNASAIIGTNAEYGKRGDRALPSQLLSFGKEVDSTNTKGSDRHDAIGNDEEHLLGPSNQPIKQDGNGIYRPPRIMPVAYDPDSVRRKKDKEDASQLSRNAAKRMSLDGEMDDRRGPSSKSRPTNRALLSELTHSLSSHPFEQSSSGTGINTTGGANAGVSKRAQELERMRTFEEENFTRLILNKKDERRRRREEENVALGGARGGRGRSGQSGGFEAELGGLLATGGGERSRKKRKKSNNEYNGGDSYESLRQHKAPRASANSSGSKANKAPSDGGRMFEKNLKKFNKRR